MHVLDLIFFALLALFVFHGLLKGFIGAVFSVAAVVFGLIAAVVFARPMGELIMGNIANYDKLHPSAAAAIPSFVAFILLFLIVFIVIKLLEAMLRNGLQSIHLGGLDKMMGGVLGVLEGLAVVCVVLLLFKMAPKFDHEAFLATSLFNRLLSPILDGGGAETKATTAFVNLLAWIRTIV